MTDPVRPGSAAHPVLGRRGPASTQDTRRHNLAALLELIHQAGTTSRADLTELTQLNRSTVKVLCDELVTAGLLTDGPAVGTGRAGRPSLTIGPRSGQVYALALNIGVENLTAVRVGLGGIVGERREMAQDPADLGAEVTVSRLERLADELVAGAAAGAVCVGVGVGVCGIVSDRDGLVRFAPNLGWHDVPLRTLMERRLSHLPIHIGNDADLGALAEHLRGAARGLRDIIYISGEVGIGGGVLLDGRPMGGAGGFGGEIGHMLINPAGRQCRCGRRGCWETEIGEEAVLASTCAPAGARLADVLDAHAAGAAWTRQGMTRVGDMLGAGVVNLINIFNPEAIIFGGTSQAIFRATQQQVRAATELALLASRSQVRLLTPQLGLDALPLGAAELAFATLLADPIGRLGDLQALALTEPATRAVGAPARAG